MSNGIFKRISEKGLEMQPELVEIRRRIHRNPELGFAEWETVKLIGQIITDLGLKVSTGIAKTGLTALLPCDGSKYTVALRADMDALPIEEQNDVPYKSTRPGVMHACGHDAHVAMLLGAARILVSLREELKVNVKFIFQPCEEQPSGGATPMINQGVLENPRVDAIFGLHVNPYLPAGFLGVREGTVMAAADQFTIDIIGKGGHGASPHQAVDPIFVAAHVIQALQAIVSRQTEPVEPVVVSVCSIHGGDSFNVIPESVRLTGTVRTLNSQIQQAMPQRMEVILKGIASAFGANIRLNYNLGYPALVNDQQMLEVVKNAGSELVGADLINPINAPTMGAEDFACYTKVVPGAYFFLGVQRAGIEPVPWHNSRFDIDESALSTGAAVLAGCVLQAQRVFEKEVDL